MALTDLTFTALKQSVANFLAKSNLISIIPDLVYMAELRLFRRLDLLAMEDSETGTLTAGTATLALPTGYRRTLAFYVSSSSTNYPIKVVSPDEMFRSSLAVDTGQPRLMAVIGSTLTFAPTPDSDYTYVHHFAGSLDHLQDATGGTNWLLTNAPDVYLYATLVEAEAYLKNDPRISVWREYAEEALKDLRVEDEAKRWRGGPLVPRAA